MPDMKHTAHVLTMITERPRDVHSEVTALCFFVVLFEPENLTMFVGTWTFHLKD